MKIIVGLGNPGAKYAFSRHNLGFMLIDALAETDSFQSKSKSLLKKTAIDGEPVLLVKPQTFMNLSGQAVQELMNFYKSSLEELLVIQDDKDLPFGTMKLQKSRGHGGHNGIADIHQHLGSSDYCRLKMGVAPKKKESPEQEAMQDIGRFVLSPFNKEEQKKLPEFLRRGMEAVQGFIKQGYEKTANQFNRKEEI